MTPTVRADSGDLLASRSPKQLMFAVLAEQLVMGVRAPLRAATYVSVMSGAGVNPATTRAKLDRLVVEGYLTRIREGRGVEYALTLPGADTLRTLQSRMESPRPFAPRGSGWTVVTFTVPEHQRAVRQRLRAALTWEGFVPVRDGLWVAPGEADLDAALDPMQTELSGSSVVAFRAHDLPKYSLAPLARKSWNLGATRSAHEAFDQLWGESARVDEGMPSLANLMLLGADWYALLRADPRLPDEFLDEGWPSERSTQIYRSRRQQFARAAHEEFYAAIRR